MMSKKNINNINIKQQIDDYKKLINQVYSGKQVFDFIKYIVNKKQLIIYGGSTVDAVLKDVTDGEVYLYDKYKIPDFDVYSSDPNVDSLEIANMLKLYGFSYIKVQSAIHPGTRKIWIQFNQEAILDISLMEYKMDIITIDNMRYVHPIYTLLSAYQNITMDIYKDWYRFNKSIKKISLIEQYLRNHIENYNFQQTNIITEIDEKDKITIGRIIKSTDGSDCIVAGNFAYDYYYMKKSTITSRTQIQNAVILTNAVVSNIYYAEHDILILPLRNETFYGIEVGGIRIANRTLLIYTYYYMYIFLKKDIEYLDRIRKLILDIKTWKYYDDPKIYVPRHRYIEKIIGKREKNVFIT